MLQDATVKKSQQNPEKPAQIIGNLDPLPTKASKIQEMGAVHSGYRKY
jgi:hypothetical protein